MIVTSTKLASPRPLTLYRGDKPGRQAEYATKGIQAADRWGAFGLPSDDFLRLDGMDPALVSALGAPTLKKHVVHHEPSPFVSFTGSRRIAQRFALHDGKRNAGILITIRVHIVDEQAWDGPWGWTGAAGLRDTEGRWWLHVPNVPLPLIEEIAAGTHPGGAGQPAGSAAGVIAGSAIGHFVVPEVEGGGTGQFHELGERDDEYLVLGDIMPREFTITPAQLHP